MTKEEKLINKLSEYKQLFKTDQDVALKFTKPECFEKFGLYENNCSTGPNVMLNINLRIPKLCFLVKDFLNNRYFCKRYYYLLYIAEQLKSSDIISKITLGFHEGNMLLPVLNVEPSGCDKTLVTIYATPSEDYFKPSRFLPEQNNVKQDLFNMNLDNDVLKNIPTIFYNSSLSHDVTLSLNSKYIKEILVEQNNIQEGIKLLCVWLKQRELNIGLGAFTENLILYFIIYLLSKKENQ
ncbi:hypothetical protein NQ314_019044 [Rhamnusium bicolor]|uniref:Nucleolar protein 6 n=1 Tax=Rhamnusium bicolor TaxID=1586634 RepID=A0AAV8WPF9_9CUCU|nr:hypothetical protein NQ314_019044 [Rhamnusium bicolor]